MAMGGQFQTVQGTSRILAGFGVVEQTLFALRVPYLPDLMKSPNLVGQNERERLAEILDRQAALVANLAKWKGSSLGLRFICRPKLGLVEITLVGGVRTASGGSREMATAMVEDLTVLFGSYDIRLEPVADVNEALRPIVSPYVVELRQHEQVLKLIRGDAYAVYPFQPPIATLIAPFEALLRQPDECMVQIYLEPTTLFDSERRDFMQAAAVASTLADYDFRGLYTQGRERDPQAQLVARLYTSYAQRLDEPFLLVVQVASQNPAAARAVAQAFGSEITETRGIQQPLQDESRLPGGFDLVEARTQSELAAAGHTLYALELQDWGTTQATPGKERLRYLVDARTASAAFRFPVAIKGGVPGVPTKQIMPGYEVGARSQAVGADEILIGRFADRAGLSTVPVAKLGRHVLVVGTTGSGKTTTSIHLLTSLWEKGIPFLVIEPAKTEYRALVASPLGQQVHVFTLGDESVSPFRLNPLELLPGVRVESHISQLRACFEASLPTFGVLPSLIEESLQNVYMNKGWNLTDRAKAGDSRLMPTLGEFYFEMIRAVEERGYSDKTLQDIRAAAAGRIGSLLRGSKGRMLNTQRSIPFRELMTSPTVLELDPLNDEEKAIVILFLLTMVREYCQTTREGSRLQHVSLVEEAHRVMQKTAHSGNREVSSDSKAVAVEMFSATLSEIRGFGEGLIIADQIPGRLADDAMKNTTIKIVHRLPGQDDRIAVGATMNLGEEQEPYLAKLPPGQAAFFMDGYEKPTFVQVPDYRAQHELPERIPEARLEAHMGAFREQYPETFLPFPGCLHCTRQCAYRDRVGNAAYNVDAYKAFRNALFEFESQRNLDEEGRWNKLIDHCQGAARTAGLAGDPHAGYCYFVHHFGGEVSAFVARRLRGEA